MKQALERYLLNVWYGEREGAWLRPAGALYALLMRLRRWLYRVGVRRSQHPGVPVIVVGNLTAGGTGKTPLTVWLVAHLRARGCRPAVVSRGYGGKRHAQPQRVHPQASADDVGDEPLLLARRTGAPVWVHHKRYLAAVAARDDGANVLICDDGLQHLALARDMEIAVVDGARRYGNGRCLPAGPLREAGIREVDAVIVNGGEVGTEACMRIEASAAVSLASGTRVALTEFAGRQVHAIAAIGNPQRFFATLRAAGIEPVEHPFPDHASVPARCMQFDDGRPVLMTEKDAVKYRDRAATDAWYVPVDAVPDAAALHRLDALLDRICEFAANAGGEA